MNDNNEIKDKAEETVNEIKDNLEEKTQTNSNKGLLIGIAVVVVLAAIVYFVFNGKNKKDTDLSAINIAPINNIGKVDMNKLTFEDISKQYIKVAENGMVENDNIKIKVSADKFGAENDLTTFDFNDDIKVVAKSNIKNKEIFFDFNQNIDLKLEKTENFPGLDIKDFDFDFNFLAKNTAMYFKINFDLAKAISYIPKEQQSQAEMVKLSAGSYLNKYFYIDLAEAIEDQNELSKFKKEMYSIERIEKQMKIVNENNKKFNAITLKSTGNKENLNGVNIFEYEIELGEIKNVLKFAEGVINDMQKENNNAYTEEQKSAIEDGFKKIDEAFADEAKNKALEKVIEDNTSYVYKIWVSENGLPVKYNFKFSAKDGTKLANEIAKIYAPEEQKKQPAIGSLVIDLTLDGVVNYNQDIKTSYPKKEEAIDLMKLIGGFFGGGTQMQL